MSQSPRKEILKGFLTKNTPQREELIAFVDQDLRDEDVEEETYLFTELSKQESTGLLLPFIITTLQDLKYLLVIEYRRSMV
ncbi:hypothetical protein QNI16_07105 [Cytophagaceae bacterium YF14B1]|uniref:Uncharacterized protein n=1 Tax=Xanthocytophaga flava TaxID=3048013 RepID=A0AAE3QJ28_9BACT|nr:hypothetical protein [Xanthocytophaga flavus]MDJ1480247.1 hypothetical protein [Xanthocytophaga flavus]